MFRSIPSVPCSASLWLLLPWLALAEKPDLALTTHFQFREPRPTGYHVEDAASTRTPKVLGLPQWAKAWPDNGSTNYLFVGKRIVLGLKSPQDLAPVLEGRGVRLVRTLSERTFILEANDIGTALGEAASLALDPRVEVAYPVKARRLQKQGAYAAQPNDPFFFQDGQPQSQWQANLENRDTNGVPLGLDLNVRAAWPITRGRGVLMAIADDGIELDHPDLVGRTRGTPHYSFVTGETNGMPSGPFANHATAVAGLAAATLNNKRGVTGVAPEASIASWVIFGPNDDAVSEELLMDMFQYQSNIVSVQNHSWGKVGTDQVALSSLEDLAIGNAVKFGRGGRGIVLVRAGGNGRENGSDANDDGYVADPRVIGVAAARLDGRVARYGSPGACLLVAAPSGDVNPAADPCLQDSPNLVTTDRQGSLGYNSNTSSDGGGDYTYGVNGFSGTSGATPQISGVVALMLAANTNLTSRDVQQVLIHSSRFYDLSDPTLATNGAGFRVSHNLGFGVPDAGRAVQLARAWSNRPPAKTVTYSSAKGAQIPDLGFRVSVEGTGLPDNLRSIVALPGDGLHPDNGTALLPLADVGEATSPITADLRGRAALIQRGPNYFCEKMAFASQAGAQLAIIYNNRDATARISMAETDLVPIPSVFINQVDGEALHNFLITQPDVRAGITVQSTNYTFQVTDSLLCEFVGLRLATDHTGRGDLRIVLTSPSGTRSILQRVNQDTLPGPIDWTYYSVQHFYESSFGPWTLTITDEDINGTGSVKSASLLITGVPMTDSDHDGLDDAWELQHFHTLAYGPLDDPDGDGYSNAREQIMGTNPNAADTPFQVDLSKWNARLARLSWPSNTNTVYHVQFGSESVSPLALTTNILGRFPETEWFVPYTNLVHQFFQLEALPRAN